MKNRYFSRVDRQVALLLGITLFLFGIIIYGVSIKIYQTSTLKSLSVRVQIIQEYIENHISASSFTEINTKEDMKKNSYQELKHQMEEIRSIGDVMYLYTAKKDKNGNLVYVVDGLSEKEDFRYPGDRIEPEIQPKLERALLGEIILPDKILKTNWGNIYIAYFPLHDSQGKIIGALGIEVAAEIQAQAIRELSEAVIFAIAILWGIAWIVSLVFFRRISNPLYKDMANTDFMTSLKNRNAYELDRHNLEVKKKLDNMVVFVIDVNNLKLVNDKLGHDIGDLCIENAGKILREVEYDKISAYRYGGDEFILLVEDCEDPSILAERLKRRYKKYGDDLKIPVTLAIGYAKYDETIDRDILDTQKRADAYMYKDKIRIKNELI